MSDHFQEYWNSIAEALVRPLQSESLLGEFVSNPNLTGAYAEAWVRWLVRSMVGKRYEVSTGAVIRSSDRAEKRPGLQSDLIVWDPSELPAPLSIDDFALVPSFPARALVEVKRTCSNLDELHQQLVDRQKALPLGYRRYVLGVVVRHRTKLFELAPEPDWIGKQGDWDPPRMTRLLTWDGKPDPDGMFALIHMLSYLMGHRGVVGSNALQNS